ncbi:hypothetical protein E2562_023028 [Oryza meyeriana var. granulata]|uniref:Uncharacterized protein n=1 Tax=Oryza meyeriana var. granulata TaxID=110450 RepID=A0A6G1EYF9_9ORYZ|nr:hypothetical protein E2562_023028 [Oryza meyeriana var. granulata]
MNKRVIDANQRCGDKMQSGGTEGSGKKKKAETAGEFKTWEVSTSGTKDNQGQVLPMCIDQEMKQILEDQCEIKKKWEQDDQIASDRKMAEALQLEDQTRLSEEIDLGKEEAVLTSNNDQDNQEGMGTNEDGAVVKRGEDINISANEDYLRDENEKVQLEGSEEVFDSQESVDFAKAVGVCLATIDEAKEDFRPRRCPRLQAKEDKEILSLATDRKEAKNNFVDKGIDDIPSFIHDSNASLAHLASVIGIELGCEVDSVDSNLNLIKSLEHARLNLFLKEQSKTDPLEIIPDKKDFNALCDSLQEFISEDECSDKELEDKLFAKFQISSAGKLRHKKKGNLEIFKVTPKKKRNQNIKKKKANS